MRLLRLKITDPNGFRSLKEGFEINFVRDKRKASIITPFIFTGINGSGKSNVLEALSEIFYHLDCIYLRNQPDYFNKSKENPDGFNPIASRVNAYELEYITFLDTDKFSNINVDSEKKAHIKIIKTLRDRPRITWVNKRKFKWEKELDQAQRKSLLPEYVVGYASGANETLSIPFFKSCLLKYDEYTSFLKFLQYKPELRAESSLVFLKETYSQAILLANLLMQPTTATKKYKEGILQPFKEYVGLEDVAEFRLVIRLDVQLDVENQDSIKLLQNLNVENQDKSVFIKSYLEKLKRCATTYAYSTDIEAFPNGCKYGDKEYLILDYKVTHNTKKSFQFHFDYEPLRLFELFQLLLVLDNSILTKENKQKVYNSNNIYLNQDFTQIPLEKNRILRFKDFKIKKKGLSKYIYTKELSDGEHQFLHTLGLCLLFKNTKSLFLLDEPETHFNPRWKAHFISSIKACFDKKNKKIRALQEILITTHSPFIISDTPTEYVRWFVKENEKVFIKPIEFITFGASIQLILDELFKRKEVSELALDEIKKIAKKLKKGDRNFEKIEKSLAKIGPSIQKRLLENYIMQLKHE